MTPPELDPKADYTFLKKYNESEKWVWLAGRLDEVNNRMAVTEEIQDDNSTEIENNAKAIVQIQKHCAGNKWISASLKWVYGTFIIQSLAVIGYLIKKLAF